MVIEYVATEFAGDPPSRIARWYKVQAGTYARCDASDIEMFNWAALKVELSSNSVERRAGIAGHRSRPGLGTG